MVTSRTHSLHHQAVQHHFGIGPKAYQASATKGVPGLRVLTDAGVYQVETFADREKISREQLSSVGDAVMIPMNATILLEGVEFRPGFFSLMLDVLDELDRPMRYAQAKADLSLCLSISQLTGDSLWETMEDVGQDLVATALVAATRLPGGEQLASLLAGCYFVYGQDMLCQLQEGLFAHFPFAGTAIIIYEVADWD